jgi:2-polyprenyl-3-methyl-5-hydroxy-6-metoxy-1,4-benzoquinol methylase
MLPNFELEYVRCDLCGQDDAQALFRRKGAVTGRWFNVVRCKKDGLIYLNPRIPKSLTGYLYNEAYYAGQGFDNVVNYIGELANPLHRLHLCHSLLNACDNIRKRLGTTADDKIPRLLDVGCGNGLLLKAAKQRGFEVLGVDFSPVACRLTRDQGLPVYWGEVTDDYFLNLKGSFDVVTAVELIEHLYEPKHCLRRIYQLLKPGGVFFYTTPNAEALLVRQRGEDYLWPEGHIYHFTPDVITRYFMEIGFQTLNPYEYPTFSLTPIDSSHQLLRNIAKWALLHSKFLRVNLLRPYLKMQHTPLMPMARKPLA